MRVLDTVTGQFVEVLDHGSIRYAILSHTWESVRGEPLEQIYEEIKEIQHSYASQPNSRSRSRSRSVSLPLSTSSTQYVASQQYTSSNPSYQRQSSSSPSFLEDPQVSEKIRRACTIAYAQGYRYLWIDSCCINKTSSTELSEAINSMFAWYRDSAVCYAFLADVPRDEDLRAPGSRFRYSRWFKRGWTLQELIAPRDVVFLSREWNVLGSKSSLSKLVEEITGVPRSVLTHTLPLPRVSVAVRMSWASQRETSRTEDKAYSLMGIFDISIAPLYGEGERAFVRLQTEILRSLPDQSIFAWGMLSLNPLPLPGSHREGRDGRRLGCVTTGSLFASSPRDFVDSSGTIRPLPHDTYIQRLGVSEHPLPDYTPTPYGLRALLPLLALVPTLGRMDSTPTPSSGVRSGDQQWFLILLPCEHKQQEGSLLGRICHIKSAQAASVLHAGLCGVLPDSEEPPHRNSYDLLDQSTLSGLFVVSLNQLRRCRRHIYFQTVYMPFPTTRAVLRTPAQWSFETLHFRLCPRSAAVLETQGFKATLSEPSKGAHGLVTYKLRLQDSVRRSVKWSMKLEFGRPHEREVSNGVSVQVHLRDRGRDASHSTQPIHRIWIPSAHRFELCHLKLRGNGGIRVSVQLGLDFQSMADPCYLCVCIDGNEKVEERRTVVAADGHH
ncbi:HET-domain-containing protein [Ganoderma leucocontextum]|nr:HET-domain-containing protein [Ganoderma leucocontextum]